MGQLVHFLLAGARFWADTVNNALHPVSARNKREKNHWQRNKTIRRKRRKISSYEVKEVIKKETQGRLETAKKLAKIISDGSTQTT